MTSVEQATKDLADAERELAAATASADAAHEAVIRELVRFMPAWWLEQAKADVSGRPEVAQALGREVIQTLKREVEALGARAEDVIRLDAARSEYSFPHLGGPEGDQAQDLMGHFAPSLYLPVRPLTKPLRDLLVKHRLLEETQYDPLRRWKHSGWDGRDPLNGDGEVQAAFNTYKIEAKGWGEAVRDVLEARRELEHAKADDLWD